MKAIPLTQGYIAVVDDDDWRILRRWKWCVQVHGERAYALRRSSDGIVWMHRQIVCAPKHLFVDHINGDGLDNRRENIRLATKRQNSQNMVRKRPNKTSRFKGVSKSQHHNGWRATIKVNGARIHLGYFKDESDAARAYDAAAIEHFGPFAAPNEREPNE